MKAFVATVAALAIVLGAGEGRMIGAAFAAEPTPEASEPSGEPTKPTDRERARARERNETPARSRLMTFGRSQTLGNGRVEYLSVGTPAAMDRAAEYIESLGATVLRRQDLGSLGLSMVAVDLNERISASALQRRLLGAGISVALDRNSIFAPSGGSRSYAADLVGAPVNRTCALPGNVRIGLIDGPVDTAAPGLSKINIVSRTVLDDTDTAADPGHATGLVSLIAGQPGARDDEGLAVGAQIYSAVAFARGNASDEAGMRLDHFARGLDWLLDDNVDIVNMSLSGPDNRVLSTLMSAASARGVTLIAATGNQGRGQVAYPAADPHVIAVTAIDARLRLYRAANRGDEVDFAAPGVDLLVSDSGGRSYRSGTSYAAAIASAIIAHEVGKGVRGKTAIVDALKRDARDLGAAGHDSDFGWGLLQLPGC